MKTFLLILSLLFSGLQLLAQQDASIYRGQLPEITMDSNSSLHIISPEPIRYVDISTHSVKGDLPEDNVLRLKWAPDSTTLNNQEESNLGIITVIGESYIAQYHLHRKDGLTDNRLPASFNILPEHTRPLELPIEITTPQLRSHAVSLLAKRSTSPIRKTENYGIRVELNNVFTVANLVLLDITYHNDTNLPFEIDELRFKIEDRKVTKATNIQSIEIPPFWQLYAHSTFKRTYRNIYVLKKVTFPASKILSVELSEKQISGRTIILKIKYKDILEADLF
ncbi:conjugative transposon protein TraN [Sphingobacterium sp. CZ-UAM]|uniref:conjugative transposon protein TraN n=1 Tax=Sphingobacterium sp. CZ-UAM TaxID=1933868 RepID=UPI000986CF27|nr:conjugative transposon protein TraN [Sphingobacterium sp. CZ-UAM]OOG19649.1 conjugative transposon protein TraN [Sphingobacterium sp. CZ-UAM]